MSLKYLNEMTCSIGVSDIDASINWFEDVLGFKLLYKAEEIAWAEMSTGLGAVNLGLGQVENVTEGGGATPVWGVTDITASKAHLEQHDVKLDGDIQDIPGLVKLLTFYDIDGNAMMLFEHNQDD
ncbi:MAG: VOC family protein [Pseudomonadota bacterium]